MTQTEQMIFHQRISLPYRYTAGAAQRSALEGFRDAIVRGSRCEACDIVLAPARPFCPRCSSATGAVVELPACGTLEGWTVRTREGASVTYGLVRLDGADSVLLHRVDVPADDLEVGMRVAARWAAERTGEITDIDAFVAE
jgi:uncharacterized OB-fold protein